MPNRDAAGKSGKVLIPEHLRHKSHIFVHVNRTLIQRRNPCRFLAAMLKRKESEKRDTRCFIGNDCNDAAGLSWLRVIRIRLAQTRFA
jgi:hypothetical protein